MVKSVGVVVEEVLVGENWVWGVFGVGVLGGKVGGVCGVGFVYCDF